MLIYNVTAHVETSIEQEWLLWMKEDHLPKMVQTGCFLKAKLFKVITDQDQGGISYATQYHCSSSKEYEDYIALHAKALRQDTIERFGNTILVFRTQLEEITTVV
jgi:hypothetical protein